MKLQLAIKIAYFFSRTKVKMSLWFLFCLLGLVVFTAFREFEENESNRIQKNIEILLRNEINMSNPYAVSKTLVDLQIIGIFKAALLRQKNNGKSDYFDSISSNSKLWLWLNSYRIQVSTLRSVNGAQFELLYIRPINLFALIVEVSIYILISLLGFFIPSYVDKVILDSKRKMQLIEAEKNFILEVTRQVQHDIASPLTVLRSVAAVSKTQNPEVYEVLAGAVKRTEEIFSDFSQKKEKLDPADLLACLNCIISEKKAIWANRFDYKIQVLYSSQKKSVLYVSCPEGCLKRILSNILNNAYEAVFAQDSHGGNGVTDAAKLYLTIDVKVLDAHILVRIMDNGPGFHASILPQVGNKGRTYGKTNNNMNGSGIGLYHAKEVLKNIGGYIEFGNQASLGAVVSCYLPRI